MTRPDLDALQALLDKATPGHHPLSTAESAAHHMANASVPESRTGPLDHQSAAGTNCAAEDGARPSPESARGPAADPIADLCARLRALCVCHRRDHDSPCAMCAAADALERLARERDALREVVRAADAMRAVAATRPDGLYGGHQVAAYDRARAKVKVTL